MHANTLYTVLGLVASASAHVKMNTPNVWTVDNGPLFDTGENFPCKGVAYDTSVERNVLKKGQSQPMKFTGSAVHGGGSCQVSLTTDLEPTKDSVWKVIKSIEGGCPAQGVDGNYPENAELAIPFDYDFEIPEDVPAGKYTLAWTWFNKIGNREMYMNCAPAEAVGDGGDEASFNALPDMFVANVDNGCSTEEGYDLEFPNPGKVVERLGSGELRGPTGSSCGSSGGSTGGETGGDYGSGNGDETGGETEAPSESAPASPVESLPGAVESLPGAINAPIEEATSEEAAPVETQPASSPEPEAPAVTTPVADEQPADNEQPTEDEQSESEPVDDSYEENEQPDLPEMDVPANNSEQDDSGSETGEGSGSGGYPVGSECATVGSWNCVDGKSFQRCGSGTWSAVQQLSAGTECTPGEGESIQMVRKRGNTRFGAKFLL